MLQYILECIAFQLLFLVIYDFFLKRETFFQWNRVYLLGTYALSMLLPWIKIEALKNRLPQQFNGYSEFLWNLKTPETVGIVANAPSFDWTWQEMLLYGGMIVATLILGYKLRQLYQLRRNGKVIRYADFTQVVISNSTLAFSFFKSIFIGDKVLEKKHDTIIAHELVHIKQRHTWDLLFFELMRIIGWFNPLVYVYQNRTAELHEFIADAQVAKERKSEHYQQLLSQVFQTEHISFINQFFTKSLIKKRIVMLQKSKSKKVWQLKYLLLVPMVLGMLAYTSSKQEFAETQTNSEQQSIDDAKLITEVKDDIEKEIVRTGSLKNVFSDFAKKKNKSDDLKLPTKKEFFTEILLHRMLFSSLKVEFGDDVLPRKKIELPPLPSSSAYNSYMEERRVYRILDENLRISIHKDWNGEGLGVRQLKNGFSLPMDSYLFTVQNVSDLTGNEVKKFNQALDLVFIDGSKYNNLVITDDHTSFQVFESNSHTITNSQPIDSILTVPFATVENVPVFPGCQNSTDKRACFNEKIQEHISKNFNYPLDAQKAGIQGRVSVMFTISSKGTIENIKMRGPDKLLEDEVERIIKRLPNMTPGKNKSKAVNVPFSIPVNFVLQDDDEVFPFAEVDQVPVFPGCESVSNKRACFNDKIQEHISKNFNYPTEAQKARLQGRVSVMFTIASNGFVQNIKSRGPNKLLTDQVERIIQRLPQMNSGRNEGKNVNVVYSIPVDFKLN